MSFRDWIKHPAFGVAVFAAFSGGLQYGDDYWSSDRAEYAYEQTKVTDDHAELEIPTGHEPALPGDVNANGNESENVSQDSNEPNWADVSDLFAQWAMALSTIGILILTGFGLHVLRLTLNETEAATVHVRKTLKEAKKTTKITREIGESQVRAYLSFVSADIIIDEETNSPALSVKFKNSGQSPAKRIHVVWEATAMTDGGFPILYKPGCNMLQDLPAGGEDQTVVKPREIRENLALANGITNPTFLEVHGTVAILADDVFEREIDIIGHARVAPTKAESWLYPIPVTLFRGPMDVVAISAFRLYRQEFHIDSLKRANLSHKPKG